MPISSLQRKVGPTPGNGVATDFPFAFKVFATTDLQVVRTSANGGDTTLTINTDYSVILNADQDTDPGGLVRLSAALASDLKLTIVSAVPLLQPTDWQNQGLFLPETLNESLDRGVAGAQQLAEKLGRALVLPQTVGQVSMAKPQGGFLLAWDEDAQRIINIDPSEVAGYAAYSSSELDVFTGDGVETVFNLSVDGGSLANLRVSTAGVAQTPGVDFVWNGGTEIEFAEAPADGLTVVVQYFAVMASSSELNAAVAAVVGAASTKADTDGDNTLSAFVENLPFVPAPGITGWTVADDLRQIVHLIRWKTATNSWADAFDAAFSYLNAQNGGDLLCPALDLPLDRTVVVPFGRINILGKGQGSSVFKVNFSGDVFRFKAASGTYLASSVRNLSIDYVGVAPATSGYAVLFDGVGDCRAIGVGFTKTYRGIGFEGNNRNCRAFDCGGADVVDAEFIVNGGGNQYIQLGTTFDSLASVTSCSVRVVATERVDLDFFTSSHHAASLEIKPVTGGLVQNIFSNFCDLDAANNTSVIVDPANANTIIRNLYFRAGSMSAAAGVGIHVKDGLGQVGDIWLNGVMIQSNLKEGCVFEKGRIHLTDCLIGRNGSNSGEPGIRLKAGVTSFNMVGGAVGPILGGPNTATRPMSLENFQLYGLVVDSGFAGSCSLDAVDFRGNITGPIQNNSAVAISINNCPGVGSRLVASGVGVINSGTAFTTVTPGAFGYALSASTAIIVSPRGAGPSTRGAVTSIAVGAITATTFDVIVDPFINLTDSLGFSWAIYAPY